MDSLPPSLTALQISSDVKSSFNQTVDCLPPSLTFLQLAPSFNQPLDHLPKSLTTLILDAGGPYKHPLDHLPSLQKLWIGRACSHIPRNLPLSLSSLLISVDKCELDHFLLPPSLQEFTFGYCSTVMKFNFIKRKLDYKVSSTIDDPKLYQF